MADLSKRAEGVLASLRKAEQDAENAWTPGQALGEIDAYLRRAEAFPDSSSAASSARARTRLLTTRLRAAAQRAKDAGIDVDLAAVLRALAQIDSLLSAGQALHAPAVRSARELIRLEISSTLSPPAAR